jgi:AraC-like DNA-binding protein
MTQPTIVATFVRALLGAVAARGIDARPLMERVGLCSEELADVDARVSLQKVKDLWEGAADATQDPDFGLHVGVSLEPRALGLLGHALERSASLRDAFDRMARYNRIVDSGSFGVETDDTLVWVRFRPGPCRQLAESSAASAVGLARRLTHRDDLAPRLVRFDHERPPEVAEHERVFRCLPEFGYHTTEVAFDVRVLDLPCAAADAELAACLDRGAEAILAALPAATVFCDRVRDEVTRALLGGEILKVERIAKRLGTTVRTLHRRLQEEGTSYSTLVDRTRYDLARRLLRHGTESIDDIAYVVGFSDISAFSRAFRRWSGETPRAFRRGP